MFFTFSSKITEIFDDWHETGHEFYEKILHEKSQFLLMILKAKEYCTEILKEEELKFIDFKENVICYLSFLDFNVIDNQRLKV